MEVDNAGDVAAKQAYQASDARSQDGPASTSGWVLGVAGRAHGRARKAVRVRETATGARRGTHRCGCSITTGRCTHSAETAAGSAHDQPAWRGSLTASDARSGTQRRPFPCKHTQIMQPDCLRKQGDRSTRGASENAGRHGASRRRVVPRFHQACIIPNHPSSETRVHAHTHTHQSEMARIHESGEEPWRFPSVVERSSHGVGKAAPVRQKLSTGHGAVQELLPSSGW